MEIPITYLEGLTVSPECGDTMWCKVGIMNKGLTVCYVDFPVSLSCMGLNWEDEFEMEFSKDIQRDMNKFYAVHQRIPTAKEYRTLTERHVYHVYPA